MEKQPQPVFCEKQGEASENEKNKVNLKSPDPPTGMVIVWQSIFCVYFRIFSFSHLIRNIRWQRYNFLDEAMKIHRSFIASSTPILLNSSFRHTNI